MHIRKEEAKVYSFAGNKIVYISKSKSSTRKFLQLINTFLEMARCEINFKKKQINKQKNPLALLYKNQRD